MKYFTLCIINVYNVSLSKRIDKKIEVSRYPNFFGCTCISKRMRLNKPHRFTRICVPAGVSLVAEGVDALGQGVMQTGINHIQIDGFLMHLAARVPVQHAKNKIYSGK